ncbi:MULTISPECIES: ABC transporter permease [unclassified Streptomyces]|uniref:ABC transporter permease n=1 Tax=unclassified Streptomyces TaxID=2593676 RepID=UPI000B83D83D|nr:MULTISPECIES: ABC transporter permease [unclassified Streptomyces]MYS18696.1 ABC transporter permease [Streptomyces sp. SID4948]
MIWSQLRRRRGRALALATGILVAATSFTLLTSTVTTSQARTVGTVQHNDRSAYDVLVRPPDSTTAVERQDGLVGANFLSGVFGGITLGQYDRIKALAGVQVAAPIANIGYLMVQTMVPVDVSAFLDSKAPSQLLRLTPTVTAGQGSYRAADQYVYLTRDPITTSHTWSDTTFPGLQQEHTAKGGSYVCWYYDDDKTEMATGADGKPMAPTPVPEDLEEHSPFEADMNSWLNCQSGRGKATVEVPTSYPVLLSAIDPAAEDQLVGVSRTVTSGRMLTERDKPVWTTDTSYSDKPFYKIPVLLSSKALTADTLHATVERLDPPDPAALPAKLGSPTAHDFVNGLPGTPVGQVTADLDKGFQAATGATADLDAEDYWTVGPVDYTRTKQGLAPRTKPAQSPEIWRTNQDQQFVRYVPEENTGTQLRKVTGHPGTSSGCFGTKTCIEQDSGRAPVPDLDIVGRYDTAELPGFSSALDNVPLETYQTPQVTGADAASRAALHNQPLRPDRNLGGYLAPPPTLLTTIDSIPGLTRSRRAPSLQDKAPVSAIRIRVAGVTGVDAASRARVNAVAGQIRTAFPGLQVDITVGSSPAPQTIALPGGLRVRENWTAKGVALHILTAVDTKSAILFVLVLVVCGLFLGQASLASVRSRRTEIGTLRCLGWSASEILRLILGELTVIGLVAGALGSLLAYGLGEALDLADAAAKAALVLPVALLLALLAGLLPAWRATRVGPLDAVTPPVTAGRRAAPVRTVAGLALRNLLRVRGRTVLGAAGLALGVAAFTVLLAVTLAFQGEVAGSLLGDAVVAQARGADYLSVALSLLLGAAGAVDVLVLSQRERAADLAVLRATGWTSRELARITLYEGIGLSVLGGLTGAVLGLAAVVGIGRGVLTGHLPAVAGAALLATVAAIVLVCAALAVPIRAQSRIAPARLLAVD